MFLFPVSIFLPGHARCLLNWLYPLLITIVLPLIVNIHQIWVVVWQLQKLLKKEKKERKMKKDVTLLLKVLHSNLTEVKLQN